MPPESLDAVAIRLFLERSGATRHDLARLMGVSARTVDNWLEGRKMSGPSRILFQIIDSRVK